MTNCPVPSHQWTAREMETPYAKWFSRPMTPPPEGVYETLSTGEIAPKLALPLADRNALLQSGYLPAERGYCMTSDGTAFVSGLTRMPGVTAEMIDWWFAWHGLAGLRYAIWNPDDHFDARVAPEGLAHRLDTSLSLRERNWGTTDVVLEDVGTGAISIDIAFMSPKDFGYDMTRFDQGAATAVNANISDHDTGMGLVCFSHIARDTPDGLELRSRFWVGWHIIDGKPVRVGDAVSEADKLALARGLAFHCAKEYHNLAAILPQVYYENRDIPDDLADFGN